MSTAPDRGGALGRVLRAHASVVDPWLRAAAAAGADAGAVRAALAEVDAVVPAVVGPDPDAADEAVLAVVRAVLDLVGRGRWQDGRSQRAAVLEVLPAVAAWVRAAPAVTVPAVVAAADVVGRAGRLEAWARRLAGVPAPEPARVRDALLVAAWRSGLPRYRDATLRVGADLPDDVLGPLLGVDSDASGVLARHGADPWWWPGALDGPGVLARVGGFAPWGGRWTALPRVVAGGPTGWVVLSGTTAAAVVADVHGASFVPLPGAGGPETDRPSDRSGPALTVPWDDDVTGLALLPPLPGGPVALVSRAHSYALDVVRVAA